MTWTTDHTESGYKPDERYGDVTQRDTGHNTVTCHADMGHVTHRCSDPTSMILMYMYFYVFFLFLSFIEEPGPESSMAQSLLYRFKFVNG